MEQGLSPYTITARRGSTLVGVFPLAFRETGKEAIFPSRFSDYNDIIASEDDLSVPVGLLTYAISYPKIYEAVSLRCIRQDSLCVRASQLINPAYGDQQFSITKGVCPYIRLTSSFEDYLENRGRRFRKGLRHALREAERDNIIARELDPQTFPPSRVAEALLEFNLGRFGVKSCFAREEAQQFVRSLLPDLFTERRMRAFALFEGEKMVGIDVCMVGPNSMCVWNGGFLDEARHLSPGKLLFAAQIKQAFALGLAEYDFLRGDEAYKASWATDIRNFARLEFTVGKRREEN